MAVLLLKFKIQLLNINLPKTLQHIGPLCHRWLPNGKDNAILINIGHPDIDLRVWFKQRGCMDNGFITYSDKKCDIDKSVIPNQAILDAGPLYGEVTMRNVSNVDIDPVKRNCIDDETYINFSKRILDIIIPHVQRFINILRTNYGQYWLAELQDWDSRDESIGNYCFHTLNMYWSLDNGQTWNRFLPNEAISMSIMRSPIHKYFPDYLTENGWMELSAAINEKYTPSFSVQILANTHQFIETENIKFAFIEGITALEVGINEYIHRNFDTDDKEIKDAVASFWNLPLQTQLSALLVQFGPSVLPDLKKALQAIAIRNKIVHEGLNPNFDATIQTILRGLLSTVAKLISGPRVRFPRANSGNALMPPEKWSQLENNT